MPGRETSTQRERLLAAVVRVCAAGGYGDASIARVISEARVSRASFYANFSDREDCFLATLAEIESGLLAAARSRIEEQLPQQAAAAMIAALFTFAQEHPTQARFLMNEAMAAGPRALDARDRGIDRLALLLEHAYRDVSADTLVPAVPAEILVGATYRLLASRLRHGEPAPRGLQEDLLRWLAAHEQAAGQGQWRTLTPLQTRAHSPALQQGPLRAPAALAPGRPRRSAAAVAENHRLRIVLATAELIRRDGYGATTVAAITASAGVDGRAFYRLFADKHEAFTAVHELAFQNAMAVTAGAFFAVEGWPRRIWEAGHTFTRHLEQNPTLAHASIVEAHAGGPQSLRRLEQLLSAFTIFLQEGYQYQPRRQSSPPSRVAFEAIAQANFEIIYRQARDGPDLELAGLAPQLVYLCLAPFVGAGRAGELVEEMRTNSLA
ncbi:MAG: TetR/AcrR family transcriptional regulator [Solirubrobacteraceae bacterium]